MCLGCLWAASAFGQIDPTDRDLVQIGFNQSVEGAQPMDSAYMFYYRNRTNFLDQTNLVLRLVVAPTYLDSELGFKGLLGPNTDVGIGLEGGGFADNYYEIEQGKFLTEQSFNGDGGTLSGSVYQLFNPGQLIPLHGILRGSVHYTDFGRDHETDPNFAIPHSDTSLNIRTGFRFGGMEPVLIPEVALEVSGWYEGQFRLNPDDYGYSADPYRLNSSSQLFWGRALFAYTLTNSQQNFMVSITGGGTADADRFSAYRLGGVLPFGSEFPLMLPGYFSQEFSARRFVDFTGNYHMPISPDKRWTLNAIASTAFVDYLAGLGQPGRWNTGVGGGLGYNSRSQAWKVMLDYCYGFDAIRTQGRGAQSLVLLMQIDLEHIHASDSSDEGFFKRGLDAFLQSWK